VGIISKEKSPKKPVGRKRAVEWGLHQGEGTSQALLRPQKNEQ
jgi:hypothetical protein